MGIINKLRNISKLEEISEVDYTNDVQFALYNDLSVVFAREPDQDKIRLIIGEQARHIDYDEIETIQSGFLIQPFNTTKPLSYIPVKVNAEAELSSLEDLASGEINFHYGQAPVKEFSQQEYESYVKKAVEAIRKGKYKKLVCARSESIKQTINPLQTFIKLCKTYPEAYVSLVSTREFGTWIGATPEILLEVDGDRIHTVALAGTQLMKEGVTVKTAAWTTKEIEEQAMVSRYIINRFKTIRLREFEDVGPRTVLAGKLFHLMTDFYIDKKEVDIPTLDSTLPKLLHPTSAVCGMPQDEAEQFILDNEQLDRQLYSGFLGLKQGDQMNLYVNLRCMKVEKDACHLFAGAGITQDSDPQKEWEETGYKMDTLKRIL